MPIEVPASLQQGGQGFVMARSAGSLAGRGGGPPHGLAIASSCLPPQNRASRVTAERATATINPGLRLMADYGCPILIYFSLADIPIL